MQRVVHELVRQPRLLDDAARRNQVRDAVRLHVHALDVALAHEPLQVDVGQPERDAELGRERPLCDARVLLDRFEQLQIAMRFDIHQWVTPWEEASSRIIAAATRSAERPSVNSHCSATMRARPSASVDGSAEIHVDQIDHLAARLRDADGAAAHDLLEVRRSVVPLHQRRVRSRLSVEADIDDRRVEDGRLDRHRRRDVQHDVAVMQRVGEMPGVLRHEIDIHAVAGSRGGLPERLFDDHVRAARVFFVASRIVARMQPHEQIGRVANGAGLPSPR